MLLKGVVNGVKKLSSNKVQIENAHSLNLCNSLGQFNPGTSRRSSLLRCSPHNMPILTTLLFLQKVVTKISESFHTNPRPSTKRRNK